MYIMSNYLTVIRRLRGRNSAVKAMATHTRDIVIILLRPVPMTAASVINEILKMTLRTHLTSA